MSKDWNIPILNFEVPPFVEATQLYNLYTYATVCIRLLIFQLCFGLVNFQACSFSPSHSPQIHHPETETFNGPDDFLSAVAECRGSDLSLGCQNLSPAIPHTDLSVLNIRQQTGVLCCVYIYISHGCIFSTVFYFPFIIANVQNNGVFDSFFRWSVYFLSFISQHKETQKSTCKPSIRDDTPFQTKKRGRPAPRKNIAPASYSFWSPPGQSQGGCKPSATSLAFKALGRISAGQVG